MNETPVLGCIECLAAYGNGNSKDARLHENRRCKHVDDAIAAAVDEARRTAAASVLPKAEDLVEAAASKLFTLSTPLIGIIPRAKELMIGILKEREQQIVDFLRSAAEKPAICSDCMEKDAGQREKDYVCEHWRPETWAKAGFERNWGDAAVMNHGRFEILRRKTEREIAYVILAPSFLRRPLTITVCGDGELRSSEGY